MEEDAPLELGRKLRQLRENQGWTLADVSEVAGISISHLSAIEKGTRPNPSFSVVVKLAKVYAVPLSYFLEADELDINHQLPPLAAETPHAYQEMAKQLAAEHALDDPSRLLELLAQYLRDRDHKYRED